MCLSGLLICVKLRADNLSETSIKSDMTDQATSPINILRR
jgi:hypothetical protein